MTNKRNECNNDTHWIFVSNRKILKVSPQKGVPMNLSQTGFIFKQILSKIEKVSHCVNNMNEMYTQTGTNTLQQIIRKPAYNRNILVTVIWNIIKITCQLQ